MRESFLRRSKAGLVDDMVTQPARVSATGMQGYGYRYKLLYPLNTRGLTGTGRQHKFIKLFIVALMRAVFKNCSELE